MTITDVPIAITQVGICILDNLQYETGKTGSRVSALICSIESFIISFILSSVLVPPRAIASISCMVLNGQRNEIVERYRQITTHARKAVIAVDALDESFS